MSLTSLRRGFAKLASTIAGAALSIHGIGGALIALPLISVPTPAFAGCAPHWNGAQVNNNLQWQSSSGLQIPIDLGLSCDHGPGWMTCPRHYANLFGSSDPRVGRIPLQGNTAPYLEYIVRLTNGEIIGNLNHPRPINTAPLVVWETASPTIYWTTFTYLVTPVAGTPVPPQGTYSITLYPATYTTAYNPNRPNNCDNLLGIYEDGEPGFINRTITINVPRVCEVQINKHIDFGTISDTNGAKFADGSIVSRCNGAGTASIAIEDGQNRPSGTGNRAMRKTTGSETLAYQLYRDSGRSQVWDKSAPNTVTFNTQAGMAGSTPVYAVIPSGTDLPSPGTYMDTVVVRIDY